MAEFYGRVNRRTVEGGGIAAMTQQLEMREDAPPPVKDREVQELIKVLVEAVLMLPDNEKRSVLDRAITPLFEALLTLNETKPVPGIGLIWMTLLCAGYPDYARRLSPLDRWCNPENPEVAPGSSATISEKKETPDVA
jgi:hypothetical protein